MRGAAFVTNFLFGFNIQDEMLSIMQSDVDTDNTTFQDSEMSTLVTTDNNVAFRQHVAFSLIRICK